MGFTVTGDTTLFAQWYTPVQSVTLDKHSLIMATGATYRLTAVIIPEGSGAAVNWTSSNEDVATVEGGVVKAVKAGGAIITAAAEGKADTCTVIVSGPRPGPTPTPTPIPTEEAGTQEAEVIIEEVIIEKEIEAAPFKSTLPEEEEAQEGEMVWVNIRTSGLPEGTTAVLLADGRIILLTGADEMDIEIDAIYVPKGSMQLIPLDRENRALGVYTVDGEAVVLPEAEGESAWEDVAIWLIVVLAGGGRSHLSTMEKGAPKIGAYGAKKEREFGPRAVAMKTFL